MSKKILTVDDSKTMRAIVKKQIIALGHEPLEAADGAEGLKVAAAEKPDLILLDITMPVMDGRETLLKLRERPETAALPVIMVTAESNRAIVLDIVQAGVSDYIVKPFNEAVLAEKINKVLKLDKTEATNGERASVLVVEDKENNLTIVRNALQADYHVLTATTGEQALQIAGANRPKLILVDISLPDMNGFQLYEKLKGEGLPADCKLVALCMKNAVGEQGRAAQTGFTGMLLKPFTGDEVRTLVDNLLRSQNQFVSQKDDISILHYVTKENVTLFPAFRQFLQGWQEWVMDLADSGFRKLAMDLSQATGLSIDDLRFFRAFASKASELGIQVVFAVGQPKSFELRRFWESQPNKSAATLEEAIKLLGS
jgi:two-component system cell cycle response regulator